MRPCSIVGSCDVALRCSAALTAALLITGQALATAYQFEVNPAPSMVSSSSSLSTPIIGTLIGNYDSVAMPDGTRTLPGFFGGSGNQPVDFSATLGGDGVFTSHPAGSFSADINVRRGSIVLTGLTLDLLNGSSPSFDATFTIQYQTFRTFNPNSLFIGGIPLPIPLGQLAITTLSITQTADPAAGVLTPTGPGAYDFTVPVPALIALEGTFGTTPVVTDPAPVTIPITGTITLIGGSAHVTSSIAIDSDQTNPGPFTPFDSVPLDVPTIIPTGQTAHLLLGGAIQSISETLSLDIQLSADGSPAVAGDLNGDGIVNTIDLGILLSSWSIPATAPACGGTLPCAADLNHDGFVNTLDLGILLASWTL